METTCNDLCPVEFSEQESRCAGHYWKMRAKQRRITALTPITRRLDLLAHVIWIPWAISFAAFWNKGPIDTFTPPKPLSLLSSWSNPASWRWTWCRGLTATSGPRWSKWLRTKVHSSKKWLANMKTKIWVFVSIKSIDKCLSYDCFCKSIDAATIWSPHPVEIQTLLSKEMASPIAHTSCVGAPRVLRNIITGDWIRLFP